MPDLSRIFDLHHSSWQCQILNLPSEARDRTCVLMATTQICFCWAMTGVPVDLLYTIFSFLENFQGPQQYITGSNKRNLGTVGIQKTCEVQCMEVFAMVLWEDTKQSAELSKGTWQTLQLLTVTWLRCFLFCKQNKTKQKQKQEKREEGRGKSKRARKKIWNY